MSAGYFGYVQGIAPVISYHFGAGHFTELQKLYRVALKTIAVMSAVIFIVAFPLAKPIAWLFANGSDAVAEACSILLSAFYFRRKKSVYHYA